MEAKWARGAGVALAFGLAPQQSAHAEPRAAQAALEYRAGHGCPDEAVFRSRIEVRTPGALDPRASRSLSVTLEGGEPSRGRLLLTTEGAPVMRDVTGASCDEVASALALIAAVLLERGAGPDEPGAPPASPPPAEEPPVASGPPPVPPPPAPSSVPPPPAGPAEADAAGPPPRVRWALGAQALLGGGAGPALAGGVRVSGEASIDVAAGPALRLSVAWYPGTDLGTELGPVRFSLIAGRLEVCPVRLSAGSFSLSPCLTLDAGRISASPSDPLPGAEPGEARLWLAPGALARLAWFFGPVVGVEVEGGVTVPLDRYRFYFSPEPLVYQVPDVVGTGGLGLVLRFP
jgi:hypothetical protein